jgi:hypothetical protein
MKRFGYLVLVALVLVALPAVADNSQELASEAVPGVSNPPESLSDWLWPVLLYDNGPLVTIPGGGAGGADLSELQTALGMNSLGAGHQFALGYSVADDFAVPSDGWQINEITFFAYQTGSPTTSTITGVYVQIWDGPPDAGGAVVWGDLTTNRLSLSTWSNIYRATDTDPTNTQRPIMANVATIGTTLDPGTYWVQWTTDGSLSSGPWAPPISITGQTSTGNAKQFVAAGWQELLDSGTSTPQGLPFLIEGEVVPVELQSFSVE